jgi:hypothetical protein
VKVRDILKEKRCGKVTKGVLFLHGNGRTLATQKKLAYLNFQYLDHSPYTPDLVPLEYHLFPGLKKQLKVVIFVRHGGHCFREDLVGQTSEFFLRIPKFLRRLARF